MQAASLNIWDIYYIFRYEKGTFMKTMRDIVVMVPVFLGWLSMFGSTPKINTLTVDCPLNITLTEGNKFDPTVTGFPIIKTNTGGAVTTTYFEIFQKGSCQNKTDLVTRIFTTTNADGEQVRCNQSIFIRHLTVNDIRVPADTNLVYPIDKSLTLALLRLSKEPSSLKISFVDSLISPFCMTPMRIKRKWTITDICNGSSRNLTSLVILENFENSFKHNVDLSDVICDDEGYINISPKGEFGPYTYIWNTGNTGTGIAEVGPGVYRVTITDRFNCKQTLLYTIKSMAEAADIGGRITSLNGYRVYPDSIIFGDPGNIKQLCISENGGLQYGFILYQKNPGFYAYTMKKTSGALSGVTTRDIVLIQKHILGIQKFSDTLKYLAADVNNNFNVTASDISEIRKLILGLKTSFTFVPSWYFIKTNWADVIKPFQTLSSITFKGVDVFTFPRLNADVLGLKLGDIDLSYRDKFTNGDIDLRSKNASINLHVSDQNFQTGEPIRIPIYLTGSEDLEGMQFALQLQYVEKIQIVQSQVPTDQIHITDEGLIRLSWSTGNVLAWNKTQALFHIVSIANKTGNLAEFLGLSFTLTPEVYTSQDQTEIIGLLIGKDFSTNFNKLFPNPARDIIYLTTEAKAGQIKFYNVEGKLIYQMNTSKHTIIHVQDWKRGIYFYQLVLEGEKTHSGKIVVH